MPFSQDVKVAAWRRAGGRCECTRHCPGHALRRCNKDLDPGNSVKGKEWQSHHVVSQASGGPDTLQNCQILCVPCHENTKSYGGF